MAYPPGVTTCPVSIKAPSSFGGDEASVFLEVTPSLRLIHTATGEILADFMERSAPSVGGVATVTLPHSQPGFQNEAGETVLSWPYTARVRYEYGGQKRHAPLRSFTIPADQTSVDLALIPAGPPIPALTAPGPIVTTVNGETGAVVIEGLDYALLARDPSQLFSGTITYTDGAPTSAAVLWPDGTIGVYTGTPSATFAGSIDAYTITYGTVTYTQPAVTRDASGNITLQPAIVVS